VVPYRIGVFASGGGSNLQSLLERIQSQDLPAEIAFVLSNNSKAGALAKARAFGVPAYHVSALTEGGEDKVTEKMLDLVQSHSLDLLVLAGFMKKVPAALLAKLRNRIVNIHPALLPAFGGEGFYGHKVHEGVIARGAQYSGITIHMVNEDYDAGQIVLQRVVAVPLGCTSEELGALVLKCEHAWFWQVIKGFALGEIQPTLNLDPAQAVDASRFRAKLDLVDGH
jgi:phosphoribosylglycinamide formyltransferase 1